MSQVLPKGEFENLVKDFPDDHTQEQILEIVVDYVMNYRMFRFYINQGMKVSNLHSVYRFKQSAWLGNKRSKFIAYH